MAKQINSSRRPSLNNMIKKIIDEKEINNEENKDSSTLTNFKDNISSNNTESENNNYPSFEDLQDLFGDGFTETEYKKLYNKYIHIQNNYPLKTVIHEDALIRYVKYGFMESKAIANGDADAASKWGKLCKDARADAKLNPSQLSAADLSDGMTCFSQVTSMVEKAQDIIPLLNKFVEQPQDRVDYTIWQYINYIRDLEGKPLVEYKDIYGFLSKRYEENKNRYKFLKDEGNGDFDTNDIGG